MKTILSESYKIAQQVAPAAPTGPQAPVTGLTVQPNLSNNVNLLPNQMVQQMVQLVTNLNPRQLGPTDGMQLIEVIQTLMGKLKIAGISFKV